MHWIACKNEENKTNKPNHNEEKGRERWFRIHKKRIDCVVVVSNRNNEGNGGKLKRKTRKKKFIQVLFFFLLMTGTPLVKRFRPPSTARYIVTRYEKKGPIRIKKKVTISTSSSLNWHVIIWWYSPRNSERKSRKGTQSRIFPFFFFFFFGTMSTSSWNSDPCLFHDNAWKSRGKHGKTR